MSRGKPIPAREGTNGAPRSAGWGEEPYAALAAPRFQPTAIGGALEIEQGFALPVYGALRAHGFAPSNRVANLLRSYFGESGAGLARPPSTS